MKIRNVAGFLFLVCAGLHSWADANEDAHQKLDQIPSAPLVVTMDQAIASPSVSLTDKGALIGKSTTPVPYDQVLSALAALPKSAWPYGKIVLFATSVGGQGAPAKADADKVQLDLQMANIHLLHAN